MLDPCLVEERLDRLVPTTGSVADAYWHHLLRIDPKEHAAQRLQQRMYLARYARINVFEWDGRDVHELDEYFGALVELIKEENGRMPRQED